MNATNTLATLDLITDLYEATLFARPLADNPAIVRLLHEDGCPVTRVNDATTLYPVGSNVSAAYDHPGGINVTRADAEAHGIEIVE